MKDGDGTGRACATVDLVLDDPGWLDELPDAARNACLAALGTACPGSKAVVSLVLSNDRQIAVLNRRWRNVDAPTDVLSFPSEERVPGAALTAAAGAPEDAAIELGDIVVARETVMRDATCRVRPLRDHLAHIVIHGTLHLLGYEHETNDRAEVMETMERTVLAGLGIPDPYG